jgi:hypothetical protein
MTVAVNCDAPGGPWAGCGPGGIDDGSLRLPHSVTMRSSLGVRSVGPGCLGLGAACSLIEFGGAASSAAEVNGVAYRIALPSTQKDLLPALLLWIQVWRGL